jgi:CRISPR-associated protein Cmr4
MEHQLFYLHALSALHAGTGQGVGAIDLPIARARATQLPLLPGSSLKGVLRDHAKQAKTLDDKSLPALFGPDNIGMDNPHAGALVVGDANLLILPVRAFCGVVAFATCPFILRRYARDLPAAHREQLPIPTLADTEAALPDDSSLSDDQGLLLEDLDLSIQSNHTEAKAWGHHLAEALYPHDADWREEFVKHFAILPDNVFSFLADTATEIRARVRIDPNTRTVATGALWYEENLPAESVLWGMLAFSPSRNSAGSAQEMQNKFKTCFSQPEQLMQLGGKHTIGRGLCRLVLNTKPAGGGQA